MRKRLMSYGPSRSARDLSRALGILRIKREGSRYTPRSYDVVINWGRSTYLPGNINPRYINSPGAVQVASNKLLSFEALQEQDVTIPEFTTDAVQARHWLSDGRKVLARTMLRASSGRGIQLFTPDSTSFNDNAPLYVKYVPKMDEYRVHVIGTQVVDVQRKMRSRDVPDEEVNWQIRNHSNGFIFGREGVEVPQIAKDTAVQAVQALGLDFGAVDIIHNSRNDLWYVLEVNTAPGLEGTTLAVYTDCINELLSL